MKESFQSKQPGQPGGELLQVGEIVAERFKIERFMGVEVVGESYLAFDLKDSKSAAVTIVPAAFFKGPNLLEKVKSEVESASRVVHRNVLTCYSMGFLPGGSLYLATEYLEGQKLYSLLRKRFEKGKHFSLKGAYNVIANLCNGLEEIHKTRVYGSLSPFSVRISTAGRVKITDLPLSRLYYLLPQMRREIPSYVQSFWAPEVLKMGSLVTPRADIFSLGAVLYELLTSRPLAAEGTRSIHAQRGDLPQLMDDILEHCLAPDPSKRWEAVTALKKALLSAVEKEEAGGEVEGLETKGEEDLLLDLEIDIEQPMLRRPPPPPMVVARPAESVVATVPSAPPAWQRTGKAEDEEEATEITEGDLYELHESKGTQSATPAVVRETSSQPVPPLTPTKEKGGGKINLDEILSSLKNQDAEKWMVTKDGLDHGPFRAREVVQMIMRWEIEGSHLITDIERGVRVKLRESEEFREIVERARVEKQRKEEMEALRRSEKAEKRGGVAKILIVAAAVGGIVVLVGGFFVTRAAVSHFRGGGEEIDLMSKVKIDVGESGLLEDENRGGREGKKKGGGGARGLSYEEYMSRGVDIGDLMGDGGQVQLSQAQINAVMSSQGKKLYPCIYAELKKNPNLKRVSLKFAIEGKSGSVQGVTVTSGGSSELHSCISSKMRSIKFPTFSAPRMGASFYFDVGE